LESVFSVVEVHPDIKIKKTKISLFILKVILTP